MRGLWVMTFFILLACVSFGYDWSMNPGDGSLGNPYQISTAQQLMSIGSDPNLLDKQFILTSDIDLNPALPGNVVFNTAVIAPAARNHSYGFHGAAFTGAFNGNNHKITRLTINAAASGNWYLGLFGSIKDATVKNLKLEQVSITGGSTSQYLGALCGYSLGGVIEHCSVAGSVETAESSVGGLIGYEFYGNINYCSSSCNVAASTDTGGLVGYQDCSFINDSFATGDVAASNDSESYSGGLVGKQDTGVIQNSFATGHVQVSARYISCAGGLIGYQSYGTVSNSFATGKVYAFSSEAGAIAGGITGYLEDSQIYRSIATGAIDAFSLDSTFCVSKAGGLAGQQSGIFYSAIGNCYAVGTVSASCSSTSTYSMVLTAAGGFLGYQSGGWAIIEKCYSTGKVTGSYNTGGFLGLQSSGSVTACFWDTETSNLAASAGGTGKTTTEMKTLSTFTSAGWDFLGESTNGFNEVWRMCVDGLVYPRLSWEFAQDGDFACPDDVGIDDLIVLAEKWLTSIAANPATFNYACDADGNETIDIGDFAILSQHWLDN